MTISDEKLSAFLDSELSPDEMEYIRQQVVIDELLANRLAELAMVDERIAHYYASIDARPMPSAISQLLKPAPATIVDFPLLKRFQHGLQQHAAMAACIALMLGVGIAQLIPGQSHSSEWNAIAHALETTMSGTENSEIAGKRIKPRLTFINQEGQYCRQFSVMDNSTLSENIACRVNTNWQLIMTVYTGEVPQSGIYQTATGGSLLDNALDVMMRGDAFNAQAESQTINNRWTDDK